MAALHIYLIAGEESGDLLGMRLMRALKRAHPGVRFSGIGGAKMEAEGLQSRLPISELALMGFVEILPHIPRLLRHIRTTVEDIIAQKPDILITIDSPGFVFRVAKKVRRYFPKGSAGAPYFMHYVAPSVWAYKPERAKKLAQTYDEVLTLLPFEPPYFEREGMKASFVGHPLVEDSASGEGAAFRARHGIAEDALVIAVLPGSRMGEIKRHMPVLRGAVEILAREHPGLVCVMPAVAHLKDALTGMAKDWPARLIMTGAQAREKWDAFAACRAAMAKSGTVTLELAQAGVPMVVIYRVHPVSAWLIRRMLRTKYVTLVNILEGGEVIPELLQENATAEKVAAALETLLADGPARDVQLAAFRTALLKLGMGEKQTPSEKAAKEVPSS